MKTIRLFLLIGVAAVTPYLHAGDFSDFRETNRVSATDKFLISNMDRPSGSRHALVNSSNLLESLMELLNWPATGAGDVTTAQLNTASNALVTLLRANDVVTSNGVLSVVIANDTTTSNGLVTLLRANDVTTSNGVLSVVIANDTTTSNGLVTLLVGNDTTTSNALRTLLVANDTTTSNGVLSVVVANDTTTSNALRTLLIANDTTTSNGVVALLAASSGGSSNMPVATLGTMFVTNAFFRGMTNLTGDTPDFRLTGPNWAWTKPTNNQLINFVGPAAGATFGVEGYLFILSTGAAHTITFSNIVALNELVVLGSTTSVFRVINDRTNTFVMSLQDRTTGSGAVVLSNAPVIVNGTLVTPTIASFANATHSHQNAAGGGTLDAAALGSGTIDAARLSTVLQNLNGTGAITNENSPALQVNSGVISLTPGVLSNLVASAIAVALNGFSNVANVRYAIHQPAITESNLFIGGATNNYECVGSTNIQITNIVEEVTGVNTKLKIAIRNTLSVGVPIMWPAYGAQHGYFFNTNGYVDVRAVTVAPPGTNTVIALEIDGTNVYPAVTFWPRP
jgi:hypothetical protein